MRNRLTKQAMGKNDSPTTMHVDYVNPELSKYESGDPDAWGESKHKDSPWELENEKGREETNHAKKVRESSFDSYAGAVKEAQDLEAKALRCLKMAETFLGEDAPSDVIERQAVDFMTMSNKSVLATLRRMREFEENIAEARVAKVVDAVLEVIAEEEEEKEEKKEASSEDEDSKIAAIVEATLEVLAEEEEEKKAEKEEMKEEKKAGEEKKEEKEAEEMKEEKKEASDLVATITAAVLAALKAEEKKEEKEAEEMKEEKKAAEEKKEEKEAEEMKEEKEAEEMKEEKKASEEISFDEGYDVTASDEDAALLAQLFSTKEAGEDFEKEAKIKTLKNVTASSSTVSEIDKLASLWNKE